MPSLGEGEVQTIKHRVGMSVPLQNHWPVRWQADVNPVVAAAWLLLLSFKLPMDGWMDG